MISVIIPTMWKGKQFEIMLPKLIKHEKVGEIIIVDNDTNAIHFKIPNDPKITYLPQKENIFCHPAWNLGVQESKYDKICLMNDDILFDERVFDLVYDIIVEKNGIIGPNGNGVKEFYVSSPLMSIGLAVSETLNWNGYGTLMFLHKKNYLMIPDEFAIWWGDAWIYDYNAIQKRQNYTIDNFCICTEMRTTSKHFKKSIIQKENEIHENIFTEMYNKYTKKQGKVLSKPIAKKIYEYIMENFENEQFV